MFLGGCLLTSEFRLYVLFTHVFFLSFPSFVYFYFYDFFSFHFFLFFTFFFLDTW